MEKDRAAPRLEDVAAHAGVSTATVSRCLNSPDRVVEKTRRKVMEAVEALGYTPNFAARVMAAKRSFTIGAIIPTMDNAIFARGLQAFQEALHARGYTLLVASSGYDPEVEDEQIRNLVARGADGILLIGHERSDDIYDHIARRKVSALVAWSYREGARPPSVGFDNFAAMRGLVEKVIGMGHRKLGVIAGPQIGNDRARLRLEAVRSTAATHGIDLPDSHIVATPYGIDEGAEAFTRLMGLPERPTVVLCGNDVLATGALRRAQELGLEVPDDISVTGFDDIELARITTPGLTTVHVPHRDMGHEAAEALIDMVETVGAGRSVALETRLVLRGSLAPPPQG